jgi:beta-lactamase regulating signal transducer with metallopeptidase domain
MSDALTALDALGRLNWQASWHAAVLGLLVLISLRFRAVRGALSPGWRSALWLLVCVRLALPVAPALPTSIHNLYRGAAPAVSVAASSDRTADDASRRSPSSERQPPQEPATFLNVPTEGATPVAAVPEPGWNMRTAWPVALFVWLAGLMMIGTRYAWGVWRLQRLIRSCPDVTDWEVLYLADECRRECGLAARPALKHVSGKLGPTVAGFLRPQLLLSDATLQMDRRSLRFILLHEMRHIRTGDCFIAWLLRGLTAVHWFNPFSWLAARSWQAERELACDAWVLRQANADERRQYGHTLLRVLEQTSPADLALFATGMASRPRLVEQRIRAMKRPTVRSRSRQVAAVAVLTGLLLVGFADAVRSQPAPVTDTASQPNAPAATKPPAASRQPKNRRRIYIVLAEHVILVRDAVTQNADLSEFRIVTWDQLLQLLRDASKTARIVPWIYGTTGGFKQFEPRALELTKLAKELKAPTWLLAFAQYDGSQVYDAIRGPDDLKPDPSRLREGTVRLANGQPAVGATVVMHVRREFEGLIYINGKELSDSLDEVWMKTDDHGRFHFYPKTDDFTVAALHPTGFGLATGVQLAKGQAIALAPWGQIEMKGNSETGISATRTGEGKNPVKINLQTFSHTGKSVPMPAGRVWIQRLTESKITGDTLVVVGPGETKAVTIQPPTAAERAKPVKDATPKPH